MSRAARWDFVSPFRLNGCVPDSFTAVQDPANRTTAFASGLAMIARRTRSHDCPLMGERAFLLTPRYESPATTLRINEWARLAGVRVVETFKPVVTRKIIKRTLPGYHSWNDEGERIPVQIDVWRRVGAPTVAQFLRGPGRKGRWVIFTWGHAQAGINGRPKCDVKMRSRVRYAARVEAA